MTRKNEAKELMDEFAIEMIPMTSKFNLEPNFYVFKNIYAKECTLLHIEKLLSVLHFLSIQCNDVNMIGEITKYRKLKREIEKL